MASKFTDGSHRFSDASGEPRKRLPPLRGFENMPLVTLDEAIKPLIPHVPEIQHMVYTVRSDNRKPADGLTTEESASIMLYSLEWSPSENSFYCILNNMLRSTSRQAQLPPWFLYLRLLITALSKLPSTPGRTVYRGVKMDLRDEYAVGSTRVWWGFSSCTTSISVLQNDQFFGKTGARTLFSIECDTGKSIIEHSYFEGEDELLLLPGRELKVVGCLPMAHQVHMIQLKEIQPPFPNIAVLLIVKAPPKTASSSACDTCGIIVFVERDSLDADMQRVMHEALVEKRCTSLDLSRNKITYEGAAIIAKAIQNNKVRPSTVLSSDLMMTHEE